MKQIKSTKAKRIKLFLIVINLFLFCVTCYKFHSIHSTAKNNTGKAPSLAIEFLAAQEMYKTINGNYALSTLQLYNSYSSKYGSHLFNSNVFEMETKPQYGYKLGRLNSTPKTELKESTFHVIFFPSVQTGMFRTGNDCFYVDQTGVVRHSGSPTVLPDATSPPVQ